MRRRKKIIQLPIGNAEKMAKALGVSKVGIYNALAYRSYSERAEMIRQQAIKNYGGVETTKLVLM